MKNLLISLKITLVFCVVLFVGYVLVLWGVAVAVQPDAGRAAVAAVDGKIVGAINVGQRFTQMKYFWSRPSAVDYNGSGSGGSNKGCSNTEYLQLVSDRTDEFLVSHPYLKRSDVPSEMVTASGSGLDPHISVASAMVQIERVAKARDMKMDDIAELIELQRENKIVGPAIVNVLKLNIALDEK